MTAPQSHPPPALAGILSDLLTAVTAAVDAALDGGAARLDGAQLVDAVNVISRARRLLSTLEAEVDSAGHDWCAAHGAPPTPRHRKPVCRIGGDLYEPCHSGGGPSLTVADRASITRAAGERLAGWVEDRTGRDGDLVPLVVDKLLDAFDPHPRSGVLAVGLDGRKGPQLGEPAWAINVARFGQPAGPGRRSFRLIGPAPADVADAAVAG